MLLRLALVAVGAGAGFALLGVLWPESDPSGGSQAPDALADLAKPPSRAVTVLVIGVDADQLQDPNNKAAPAGAANADALLLLGRLEPLPKRLPPGKRPSRISPANWLVICLDAQPSSWRSRYQAPSFAAMINSSSGSSSQLTG